MKRKNTDTDRAKEITSDETMGRAIVLLVQETRRLTWIEAAQRAREHAGAVAESIAMEFDEISAK